MRYIGSVFIVLLFLSSCITLKRKRILQPIDEQTVAKEYLSRLKKQGIDTVGIYIKDCSGCIQGFESFAYVFWLDKGSGYSKGFRSYDTSGRVRKIENPFAYYLKNKNAIKTEVLREPKFSLMHYQFRALYMVVNKDTSYNELSDFYVDDNDDKAITNCIYRIESALFNPQRR